MTDSERWMDSGLNALLPRKVRMRKSERRLSNIDDRTSSFVYMTFGLGLIVPSILLSIIYFEVANQLSEAQRNLERALEGFNPAQLGSARPVQWEFLTFILVIDLILLIGGVTFISLGIMKKRRLSKGPHKESP